MMCTILKEKNSFILEQEVDNKMNMWYVIKVTLAWVQMLAFATHKICCRLCYSLQTLRFCFMFMKPNKEYE